jgi:hypothetical protein
MEKSVFRRSGKLALILASTVTLGLGPRRVNMANLLFSPRALRVLKSDLLFGERKGWSFRERSGRRLPPRAVAAVRHLHVDIRVQKYERGWGGAPVFKWTDRPCSKSESPERRTTNSSRGQT